MSEAAPHRKALTLAHFTPYRIVVLGQRMSEQLGAAYRDEGLTIPEWRVLAAISEAPDVAARDVASMTPMDKMAVSRAVASLVGKGLILRVRTKDRRVASLRLTAKGESVYEKVAAIALDYEEKLLRRLAPAERRAFLEGLSRLETIAHAAR